MKPKDLKEILGDLEEPVREKQLKVERDPELEKILAGLHREFEASPESYVEGYLTFSEYCKRLAQFDITPAAVEQFTYELKMHEDKKYLKYYVGTFISAAVQVSFNHGHNGFYVPITYLEKEPQYLCNNISGTKDKPLELTIEGNFNRSLWKISFLKLLIKGNITFCAEDVNSCEIEAVGNVGDGFCGGVRQTRNSKVKITGDVGTFCGQQANGCEFEINGRVIEDYLGTIAQNSKFILHQNPGQNAAQFSHGCEFIILGWDNDWRIGSGSYDNIYRCKSPEAIEELKRNLPDTQTGKPRGNKVYKIHEDSSETLVAEI